MRFQGLLAALSEVPLLGPLFQGSPVVVAIKLAVLVAFVAVAVTLLKAARRRLVEAADKARADSRTRRRTEATPLPLELEWEGAPGAGGPEELAGLLRQGQHVAAGDLCFRRGDVARALALYEEAGAWSKAGEAAARLKQHAWAASCFERGHDDRGAVEQFIEAGKGEEAERIATRGGDPELLGLAAAWRAGRDQPLEAAALFALAGKLADAERCYLEARGDGPALAAQMYLDAFFEAAADDSPAGPGARRLAARAAVLLEANGQLNAAGAIREQAGLGSAAEPSHPAPPSARARASAGASSRAHADADEAPRPASRPPHGAGSPDRGDDSIESPIGSPDELIAGMAGIEDTLLGEGSSLASEPQAPLARPRTDTRLDARFGTEVNQRYELLEELGRGGMAEVYKARDRALGRIIALKFLSPSLVGDTVAMRLFAREARAAAALNHPGIVTIYDIGVIDGRPFISMEFIEGTDLRTLLTEKRSLPLTAAVDLGARLALALDYAHERQVIHRDIKPANVIVATDGSVKLLDFGVAKAIRGGKGAASMLAGTPQYMAPEQLSQGEIDGRADIFSLGVLLYRVLTAKRPFHGLQRHADVTPLSKHAPWVPPDLERVVLKALSLDPDGRFQRGRDMADALTASLDGVGEIDDGPTVFES